LNRKPSEKNRPQPAKRISNSKLRRSTPLALLFPHPDRFEEGTLAAPTPRTLSVFPFRPHRICCTAKRMICGQNILAVPRRQIWNTFIHSGGWGFQKPGQKRLTMGANIAANPTQ
jgi:hypothetical protein